MNNFKNIKPSITSIYKTVDGIGLPLQVYFPSKIEGARTVILIHGGGWNDAIKDNSVWNGGWLGSSAKYLSSKGMIGIVISYRSLMLSPDLTVPDLVEDCRDAIMYIKENFKFVNFEDIVYLGESAGGYISTMFGLSQDDSIRPKLTISVNPVLGHLDSKWSYGFKGCSDYKSVTPIECIGEKASDFILLHGTADSVVEYEDTEMFHEKLVSRGIKSEMIPIDGANHAFLLFDYKNTDENIIKIMDLLINKLN